MCIIVSAHCWLGDGHLSILAESHLTVVLLQMCLLLGPFLRSLSSGPLWEDDFIIPTSPLACSPGVTLQIIAIWGRGFVSGRDSSWQRGKGENSPRSLGVGAERRLNSRRDEGVKEGWGLRMRNGRWTKGGQIGHGDSWNRLSNLWVAAENEPVRRFLYHGGYQVDQLAGSMTIKRDGRLGAGNGRKFTDVETTLERWRLYSCMLALQLNSESAKWKCTGQPQESN